MDSEKMDFGSNDIISSLPDALICHILSFLPTKEAALTSVLSKKWRYLFALVPNLEFEYLIDQMGNGETDEIHRMFMDFVDRVLALQENASVNKFFLNCRDGVNPYRAIRWIHNVLKRGVLFLDLNIKPGREFPLRLKAVVSNTLVSLTIIGTGKCLSIDVEDVFLPKLKQLHLQSVVLENGDTCFVKLISDCQFLEELVLVNVYSDILNRSVSSKSIKCLTLACTDHERYPDGGVSFDTPNLVYLEYFDDVADKYPKLNFSSLADACIGVRRAYDPSGDLVGNNAIELLVGIRNAQILQLSVSTLQVLNDNYESIPVFNNLIYLTIWTYRELGWESLPTLLKKCQNLETLEFQGLCHKFTTKCEDVDGCLCNSSGEIPTCLSSSPVKVLNIYSFGEITHYGDTLKKHMNQVKHFMETMPNLEKLILEYDTSLEEDVNVISNRLHTFPKASPKCKIQVYSRWIIN